MSNSKEESLLRYFNDSSCERECLRYEWKRFSTLKNLPKDSSHWVTRLANQGFFCDDNTGEIRCFFCGFTVSSNDDNCGKTDEHKKSACPIFSGENCSNIPIRSVNESTDSMTYVNTVQTYGRNMPKYPELELEKRIESFDGFNSQDRSYYHRLAIQGFFNNGASLSARCHYCGFDLRYDPSIDPFEAHAALFGNCGFLEQEKGKEFIEMHKEKHRFSHHRDAPEGQEVSKRVPCTYDEDVEPMPQTSSSHNFPPVNQNDTGARPKQLTPRFRANEESTIIKDGKNKIACKICLDAEVQICFLPCGHLVACENCAAQCSHCDVCKQEIKGRMKCYPS